MTDVKETEETARSAITEIRENFAACDGDGYAGHPRVFIDLSKNARMQCPYCSRTFARAASPAT